MEGDSKNWYFDISCLIVFHILWPLLRPLVRAKVDGLRDYLVANGLAVPAPLTWLLAVLA